MLTEDRLSDVLSEFARTLVTDFPIQGILDHLVVRIVDILPIGGAGVSLISPTTHPRFIAASDESAMRYERLQSDLGEGPCLAAYETDAPITIPDLAERRPLPPVRRAGDAPKDWSRYSPSRSATRTGASAPSTSTGPLRAPSTSASW